MWIAGDPDKIKAAADRWGYDALDGAERHLSVRRRKDDITIVQWNAVVAGAHVPDETVYKFIKALADNRDRVRSIHPSLAQFAIDKVFAQSDAAALSSRRRALYREAGVLK